MVWRLNRKYLYWCWIIVLFFSTSVPVHAQQGNLQGFSIKLFNDETSILQNTITGMAFDKKNYLWIGTQYGLFRFDGRNFSSINTFNNTALKFNRILSVAADAENNIYITDEQWNLYKAVDAKTILPCKDANDTGFLLHIPGSPAFHFKPRQTFKSNRQLIDYLHLENTGISHIYRIDSVNAYISYLDNTGKQHLSLLKDGNILPQTLPGINSGPPGFVLNRQLFFILANGNFYTTSINGTWKKGRLVIQYKPGSDSPVSRNTGVNLSLAAIYATENGIFMVNNKSLFSIHMSGDSLIAHELLRDIPLENINGVLYNAASQTWFMSTLTTGVALLHEKKFEWHTYTGSNHPEMNIFYAQAEIAPNTILTHNSIVFENDKAEHVSLPEISRLGILKDKNNHLWYLRNDSMFSSPANLSKEKFIGRTIGPVNSFLQKEDIIWFTTQDNLAYIKNDSIINVRSRFEFDSSFFQCMNLPEPGRMLVGTQRGLYSVRLGDTSIEKINSTEMYVRNITNSAGGFTWVGTYGQGMFCLYQGKLTRLPADKNGYLSTAHCFLEDNQGYFWISTNKGLFKVSKQDMINYVLGKLPNVYVHYFDKTDGFGSNEFNGGCSPCGLVLSNGKFSFPSLNGLVGFNPVEVIPVTPRADVYLDNIVIDNEPVAYADGGSFKPGFHQLEFYFSIPYYGNANNLLVEYRLEGLNTDWNILNTDGRISYNNLAKGDYTLVLRKMSDFGKAGYDEKKIRFTILPHFYETPLFYFLCFLLLIGIVYAIYKIRYQWIIRTNRKLEKEVKLHVAQHKLLIDELRKSIEELEASREKLIKLNNDKEKLISILVHDLSTPLKFLNKLATRLHTQFHQLPLPDRLELVRELNVSSTEIFIFSDNFLKWLHPSRLRLTSVIQEFDVQAVLNELFNDYNNISGFRHNKISFEIDSKASVISDRFAVKIIMRNLIVISNIYIDNSLIHFTFTAGGEANSLKVSFPASVFLQESIRKIYLTEDELGSLEIGEYPLFINFSIIKTLAAKINGSLKIIQDNSESISLSLTFPNFNKEDIVNPESLLN